MGLALCATIGLSGCGGEDDKGSNDLVMVIDDAGASQTDGTVHPMCAMKPSKAKCIMCSNAWWLVGTVVLLPGSTAERWGAWHPSVLRIWKIDYRVRRYSFRPPSMCVTSASKSVGRKRDEWSTQWHEFVSNVCGGVARGSVQSGGACERRTDCAGKHEHCLDGQCRMVTGPDLHQACTPQGVAGTLTESSECTTGWCVNTGYGGNCTVDCRDARGCIGDGFACLHLSTTGGPSSALCLTPRSIDGHCYGMSCLPIDPMDDEDTYCVDGETNRRLSSPAGMVCGMPSRSVFSPPCDLEFNIGPIQIQPATVLAPMEGSPTAPFVG